MYGLLQLRVLRLGFLQYGDVGVGVFPEGEEVLVGSFRFGGVAGEGVGTGQTICASEPRGKLVTIGHQSP
jgi:hypothetical protein